jgi:hypothetical protein
MYRTKAASAAMPRSADTWNLDGIPSATSNDYLKCVLSPETSQAIPIPSAAMGPYFPKTLKTAATLTPAAGGSSTFGLIVFALQNPTGTLGWQYNYDAASKTYAYAGAIRLQDLTKQYDYGLVSACHVTVRSNYQGISTVALSGTFQAAQRWATPAELWPLPAPDQLANLTATSLDTMGNCTCNDGVSLLAFPECDQRMIRLADNAVAVNTTVTTQVVTNTANEFDCTYGCSITSGNIPYTAFATVPLNQAITTSMAGAMRIASFKIDGLHGLIVDTNVALITSAPIGPGGYEAEIGVNVYGLAGNLIDTYNSYKVQYANGTNTDSLSSSLTLPGPYYTPIDPSQPNNVYEQPVAYIEVFLGVASLGGVASITVQGDINVQSINAHKDAGVLCPITYVGWSNLIAGSQLTVDGTQHLCLLPNPVAQLDLPVTRKVHEYNQPLYSHFLANRELVDARSVMPLPDYKRHVQALMTIADLPQSAARARASGFGDFLGSLASQVPVVGPILSGAIKSFGKAASASADIMPVDSHHNKYVPVPEAGAITDFLQNAWGKVKDVATKVARRTRSRQRAAERNTNYGSRLFPDNTVTTPSKSSVDRRDYLESPAAQRAQATRDRLRQVYGLKPKAAAGSAIVRNGRQRLRVSINNYREPAQKRQQQRSRSITPSQAQKSQDTAKKGQRVAAAVQQRQQRQPKAPIVQIHSVGDDADGQTTNAMARSASRRKAYSASASELTTTQTPAGSVVVSESYASPGTPFAQPGVMFPVVYTLEGDLGAQAFMAVLGDYRGMLTEAAAQVCSQTVNGHMVYGGCANPTDTVQVFPPTKGDVTLLPIVVQDGLVYVTPGDAPIGHSCDLAVSLLNCEYDATPNCLFTGVVDHTGAIRPVLGLDVKHILVEDTDCTFAGAVDGLPRSTLLVNLTQAVTFANTLVTDGSVLRETAGHAAASMLAVTTYRARPSNLEWYDRWMETFQSYCPGCLGASMGYDALSRTLPARHMLDDVKFVPLTVTC